MKNRKKNQKGFTLVELLVVIAIIGILAVVAVPSLFKNINKAKAADLLADYNAFKSATLSYYADNNTYPLTLSGNDTTDLDEYMESVPKETPFGGEYIKVDSPAGETKFQIQFNANSDIPSEIKTKLESDSGNAIEFGASNLVTMTIIKN